MKEPHLERPYKTWLITPVTFCAVRGGFNFRTDDRGRSLPAPHAHICGTRRSSCSLWLVELRRKLTFSIHILWSTHVLSNSAHEVAKGSQLGYEGQSSERRYRIQAGHAGVVTKTMAESPVCGRSYGRQCRRKEGHAERGDDRVIRTVKTMHRSQILRITRPSLHR